MDRSLTSIPGVGKSIAEDLRRIGVDRPSCLKNRDAEKLYAKQCRVDGIQHDRCLLYVYRCAVYFASHKKHDPQKLKWWNWSDENMAKHKSPFDTL